jgi:(heptosyl)LPS beta-1,4-glucosyltransferase
VGDWNIFSTLDRSELRASEHVARSTSGRANLSAVLIVKNEERMIEDCLESLHDWVDEIVVLDSGSTDRTLELAKKWGAKVYLQKDWQGYGIQRQRAQEHANCDYILAIDADERVSPELRRSIQAVLANPDDRVVYAMVIKNWFLGTYLDDHGWHDKATVRLYARNKYAFCDSQVHESVDTQKAPIKRLYGDLLHYSCHDYQYFLEKQTVYAHMWARQRAEQGRKPPLVLAAIHAIWTFFRLYLLQGGFLDGRYGFLFAVHASHYVFNKYAALWHYGRARSVGNTDPLSAEKRHAAEPELTGCENASQTEEPFKSIACNSVSAPSQAYAVQSLMLKMDSQGNVSRVEHRLETITAT